MAELTYMEGAMFLSHSACRNFLRLVVICSFVVSMQIQPSVADEADVKECWKLARDRADPADIIWECKDITNFPMDYSDIEVARAHYRLARAYLRIPMNKLTAAKHFQEMLRYTGDRQIFIACDALYALARYEDAIYTCATVAQKDNRLQDAAISRQASAYKRLGQCKLAEMTISDAAPRAGTSLARLLSNIKQNCVEQNIQVETPRYVSVSYCPETGRFGSATSTDEKQAALAAQAHCISESNAVCCSEVATIVPNHVHRCVAVFQRGRGPDWDWVIGRGPDSKKASDAGESKCGENCSRALVHCDDWPGCDGKIQASGC